MIGFHLGHHKTFKHYYQNFVCEYWKDLFSKTLSYNRFVEIKHRYFLVFFLFLKQKCLGKCTGISFIDSTTLKVCKNQRIHNHKVFKGIAERGKSSMGWFYGFKLQRPLKGKFS
ncbi:transposase [Bergeyella zoohelcum]|uniref:transposase n=1 Tax=Bergeyella zoohelcum TaxID=1015 RepID=UPI0035D4BD13